MSQQWTYVSNISLGSDPGSGKFSIHIPDGYVNPNYLQFSKTNSTGGNADSLLSTLISKTSFSIIVDSQNYITLNCDGIGDYGAFYRFHVSTIITVVGSITSTVYIADNPPNSGGGGGGGGGGQNESEVTWIVVGDFPNKVARSTNSGRSWTNITPIVPLEKATCGKKGGSLIIIGGEATATGSSMYSVQNLGDSWTSVKTGLSKCNAIQYNGSQWIAVGKGYKATDCVYLSDDGQEWVLQENIYLTEALNVYWMNTWIVVGKCQTVGYSCAYLKADNYWIGIDAVATIYENLNFDTIKSLVKYGNDIIFNGELDGQRRTGKITWQTEPTYSTLTGDPTYGDIKYNGTYLLSFNYEDNKFMVSTNGSTWTIKNDIPGSETLASNLVIAKSASQPSQSLNTTLINSFFTTYGLYISRNPYTLETVNSFYSILKGVGKNCLDYYNEALTLKSEIQDLKSNLNILYNKVQTYLDNGLPLEIININNQRTAAQSALNTLETGWRLPEIGSGTGFDAQGKNFDYVTALNTYESFLQTYTIDGQLQIDGNTVSAIETFMTAVNDHLDYTKKYQKSLKDYINLLKTRDTLYKSNYEGPIEKFNATATEYLDSITTKFNRIEQIKVLLQDYVTLIPQCYYDAKQSFSELNFNLTDEFNAPNDYGTPLVNGHPWIYNLLKLNLVDFNYSFNYEVQGITTVDVKHQLEQQLDDYKTSIYNTFSNTTFDKDSLDPVFTEINTLYDSVVILRNDSTTKRNDIIALYDFETIQTTRTNEITGYDAYPVLEVDYNVFDKLDEYIARDQQQLTDLDQNIQRCNNIMEQRNQQRIDAYNAILQAEAARKAAREAEEAAYQEYLQSDEYRQAQEAQLKQLQDQQAAQNAIALQQLAVQLAQQEAAAKLLLQQQAEAARQAAETQRANDESYYLGIIENTRAFNAAKAAREAEQARLAAISSEITSYANFRLSKARLLYYVYFNGLADEVVETPQFNVSYDLFRQIGSPTLRDQYFKNAKAIYNFIRTGFDIHENYYKGGDFTVETILEAKRLYEFDFESTKNSIIKLFNCFSIAKLNIEAYINSIDLTNEFTKLKLINNTNGTSVETKYNSIKNALLDELNNIVEVSDLTLTLREGVTVNSNGNTPLRSVANASQSTFYDNITTNIPIGNITSARKVHAFLIQLNTYIKLIKAVSNTKIYVDQKYTDLTNSRNRLASDLTNVIDLTSAVSINTLFSPITTAISNMLTSLNNLSVFTTITNSTNLQGINGSIDLTNFSTYYPNYFENRQKNIKKLAEVKCDDTDILLSTNVLRGIGDYFYNTIYNLDARIIKKRDDVITPAYKKYDNLRSNIMFLLFNPYGTSVSFQIDTIYNKYNSYNVNWEPRFKEILDFSYNLRVASSKGVDYNLAKTNYYTAYAGCVDNNIKPYPDGQDQQNAQGQAATFWSNSLSYYNQIQAQKKLLGDNVQSFLDSFSILKVKDFLAKIDTLENEWITTVTSNYITGLETTADAALLASYRLNAVNYVSAVLAGLPVATFPSDEDIVKFKLQGITNDIKNTVNLLKSYSTQTFSTNTISQITSAINYIKLTLIPNLSSGITNLTTTIGKIADYKNRVQRFTNYNTILEKAIDRKENIVSNYLNGPTPLTLDMSDGDSKPFIMTIKPTNTNYWEEVVGQNELNYTLFDNNWRYYVGDKVAYNGKVYRLKNATPEFTYEADLILKGNPPTFPKTDSTTVFFTGNTDYWTFVGQYQLNTGTPSLNELRSYNGDLYKCIQVFRPEEAVTIPGTDSRHWKFISTSDYAIEGAIQYYDNNETYTEDEFVLFKYQISALTTTQPYRLGKFKAVKTVSENFPKRFQYPRIEIGSTLNPANAYIDPDTNQPVSNTIPYKNTWVNGNQSTQIPRYGYGSLDPWRIEGLLKDLRYSVALGPEMAVLYAYTTRQNTRQEFYSGNTLVDSPAVASILNSGNIPDDATTVWNQIVNNFNTQSARLNVQNANNDTERIQRTIQPIYNKAYDSVFYVLDKYIEDITFLVNKRDDMKQRLYSIYQSYIEDHGTDFLDQGLSTTGNLVYRDLEVGKDDSVFYEYYNSHKDEYQVIKDKLEYYVDSINRMLALDLVEFGITKEDVGSVSMGAGIYSASCSANSFSPRYQPIGITDWAYIESNQYIDNEELDEYQFPIMSRVKRILALIARKPRYINNTQVLVPIDNPVILGLYRATVGLGIIANAMTSEIFDISGLPGNSDPIQQAAQNNKKMREFVRTIQNNARTVTTTTIITNQFLDSIEVIEDNIQDLEDNLNNLRDVNKGVQTVPNEINVGAPPTNTEGTIPLPTKPDDPKLLQLIDTNQRQLDDAKKALDDAKKALEEYKRTGEIKPVISKPATDIVEESRVPPKKSWADTIKNQQYNRGAAGIINTTGKERTRIFGSNGQPIPNQTTRINETVSNAAQIDDATTKTISDSEVAMTEEIKRRQADYDAQLSESERIARQNAETNLKNSETMRQYEADIQRYNENLKNARDERRKARIEFQRADIDYRDAVRAQSDRLEEIKAIKEKNARIVAQNEAALKAAEDALKNARAAQAAHATTVLNTVPIPQITRTLIVTNYVRNLRIVQFVNTQIVRRVGTALSRASVVIASSSAGRLASRIANSTAGRIGGALIGPGISMGMGFYTAVTEGLFDD